MSCRSGRMRLLGWSCRSDKSDPWEWPGEKGSGWQKERGLRLTSYSSSSSSSRVDGRTAGRDGRSTGTSWGHLVVATREASQPGVTLDETPDLSAKAQLVLAASTWAPVPVGCPRRYAVCSLHPSKSASTNKCPSVPVWRTRTTKARSAEPKDVPTPSCLQVPGILYRTRESEPMWRRGGDVSGDQSSRPTAAAAAKHAHARC